MPKYKEVVYRGASCEQGQSLLRLFDRDSGTYIALINADGGWESLTLPADKTWVEPARR